MHEQSGQESAAALDSAPKRAAHLQSRPERQSWHVGQLGIIADGLVGFRTQGLDLVEHKP
jgi:hypothetical protein